MLIRTITASPWQSNCYLIVSDEDATQCIVVDPGITAAPLVTAELEARGWAPVAFFGTHGHIDHVGDAGILAERYGVPLYLAAPDQHLLTDPAAGLDPGNAGALRSLLPGVQLQAVEDVRDLTGPVAAAGLTVTPVPAPGHTEGSTLLRVTSADAEVVFTGDRVALVAALDAPDPELRKAAVGALGRLGDPSAVPALMACLDSPAWGVPQAAASADARPTGDAAAAAPRDPGLPPPPQPRP